MKSGWPQVQLEQLTKQFQNVTEDMRRRFAVDGEPLVSAGHVSASSPSAASLSPLHACSAGVFRKQAGFTPLGTRSVAASGGLLCVFSGVHALSTFRRQTTAGGTLRAG